MRYKLTRMLFQDPLAIATTISIMSTALSLPTTTAAVLLAAALLLQLSSAQTTPQSGIFYWCSLIEGGANYAWLGIANNQPRSSWQVRALGVWRVWAQ